jgi:hypothetical protein
MLARRFCKHFAETLRQKADLADPRLQPDNMPQTPSFAHTFTSAPNPTPLHPMQSLRAQSVPPSSSSAPQQQPSVAAAPPTGQKQYHPINLWLRSLNGRLDGDKTDYTRYLQTFVQEDIQSTFEIIYMGAEGLTGIDGIAKGTAVRLFNWAKEDSEARAN